MSETNYSELSITDDTDEADILKDLIAGWGRRQ
jgi:hypothetical protein